ncbi:hypothetical protein M404DRAFT_290884 [Pisolithus tinctorius Marx 270]|uniref:Uncharacterized protein n=1 Tax=Pisolithus tinctorius Marx 270 TaxID=870435 RepID=A0A0C3JEP3_PISTI|nr:hypothetical protein M404DRAFT_290884 [Pisolithus tinctorius Marx 270]
MRCMREWTSMLSSLRLHCHRPPFTSNGSYIVNVSLGRRCQSHHYPSRLADTQNPVPKGTREVFLQSLSRLLPFADPCTLLFRAHDAIH